VTPTGLKPVTF